MGAGGTGLAYCGGTTNFHGAFINNGAILNADIHLAIARDGSGGLFIGFTGAPDVTYLRVQKWLTSQNTEFGRLQELFEDI